MYYYRFVSSLFSNLSEKGDLAVAAHHARVDGGADERVGVRVAPVGVLELAVVRIEALPGHGEEAVARPELDHRHLALRQRSRLIRANHRRRPAHRFLTMPDELSNEQIQSRERYLTVL